MKYIFLAIAAGIIIAIIGFMIKTPPCGGDYEFSIGGEEYFLFKCKKIPEHPNGKQENEIQACVNQKILNYEKTILKFTEGGARTNGKQDLGSIPRDSRDVCISVGPEQTIISAHTASTCCHGGRCAVTAPKYSKNNKKVCVTTKAWSENKLFGGGGCGKYKLSIEYKKLANDKLIDSYKIACKEKLKN